MEWSDTVASMRWDNLFDDLEGQLEQELSAEEVDQRAEEERLRLGRLSLRDRLLSLHEAHGRGDEWAVRLQLVSGASIAARPVAFGRDWFSADLIDDSPRRAQCIVPIAAIAGISLDRAAVATSLDGTPGEVSGRSLSARLSLPFVLRDLCRRRSEVEVWTPAGARSGTIDRVGRDHLDLAVHEPGTPRRESGVTGYQLVPLAQVVLVRL